MLDPHAVPFASTGVGLIGADAGGVGKLVAGGSISGGGGLEASVLALLGGLLSCDRAAVAVTAAAAVSAMLAEDAFSDLTAGGKQNGRCGALLAAIEATAAEAAAPKASAAMRCLGAAPAARAALLPFAESTRALQRGPWRKVSAPPRHHSSFLLPSLIGPPPGS